MHSNIFIFVSRQYFFQLNRRTEGHCVSSDPQASHLSTPRSSKADAEIKLEALSSLKILSPETNIKILEFMQDGIYFR